MRPHTRNPKSVAGHSRRHSRLPGGGLALAAAALALLALAFALPTSAAPGRGMDFGDAPDRGSGAHGTWPGGPGFPSLLESDGARSRDTFYAWLGPDVNREPDSRQVNRDRFDDGVALLLGRCVRSTAYVEVTAAPGASGVGYLNLFFDWNRNGRFGGSDGCAREWAVRNTRIDLGAQPGASRVYTLSFPAGHQTDRLWYRVILSAGERWSGPTGAGEIARGEVEDYFTGSARRSARCQGILNGAPAPDPLPLAHGGTGIFELLGPPLPGGPQIVGATLVGPALTPDRRVAPNPAVANGWTYTSLKIDGPPRAVLDSVSWLVRLGYPGAPGRPPKVVSLVLVTCKVVVHHDEPHRPDVPTVDPRPAGGSDPRPPVPTPDPGHGYPLPPQPTPEVCGDGIDNDGDGLIDLQDPDCHKS